MDGNGIQGEKRLIDRLIDDVRRAAVWKRRVRMRSLRERMDDVLRRIGEAGEDVRWNLPDKRSYKEMIKKRMWEARNVRISEAEAMADLAELCGDFSSKPAWSEIINADGVFLWKGYTRHVRLARFHFHASTDGREISDELDVPTGWIYIDIPVRMSCAGEIISQLYVGGEGVCSVGISSGEGASVLHAVVSAYHAYFKNFRGIDLAMDSGHFTDLERLVCSGVCYDVQSENSSSEADSKNTRREPEEEGE